MIPAGGGAERDSSSTPMDLLWTPAHAPAKQQTGRVSCPHLLPGQEEKTAWRRHSGWSLSTPSLLSHAPALSLPVPEEKFRFQSDTPQHACTRTTHTHSRLSPGDGTEQEVKWARAEVRYGGLLLPPIARTRDAQTHVHTCTRGRGWAWVPGG